MEDKKEIEKTEKTAIEKTSNEGKYYKIKQTIFKKIDSRQMFEFYDIFDFAEGHPDPFTLKYFLGYLDGLVDAHIIDVVHRLPRGDSEEDVLLYFQKYPHIANWR